MCLLFLAVRISHRDSTLRRHVLDPKQPAPQRSSCPGRLVVSQQRKGLKGAKSLDGGLRIKKNVLENPLDVSPEVKTWTEIENVWNGGRAQTEVRASHIKGDEPLAARVIACNNRQQQQRNMT